MSAMTRSLIHFNADNGSSKSDYQKEQKKLYPNAFKRWSTSEEELLTQFFEKGATFEELSVTLQRNPRGIEQRLKKMGLISQLAATA